MTKEAPGDFRGQVCGLEATGCRALCCAGTPGREPFFGFGFRGSVSMGLGLKV